MVRNAAHRYVPRELLGLRLSSLAVRLDKNLPHTSDISAKDMESTEVHRHVRYTRDEGDEGWIRRGWPFLCKGGYGHEVKIAHGRDATYAALRRALKAPEWVTKNIVTTKLRPMQYRARRNCSTTCCTQRRSSQWTRRENMRSVVNAG